MKAYIPGLPHFRVCPPRFLERIVALEPYVPSKTLQDIYNGLVMPYFDYCSPLWDTCGKCAIVSPKKATL